MDLRGLRYFVHVADNRSFSKAAVLLRIGQPALSRSVMQLEQELGVKLLRRGRNGVEMTPPGRILRRRARDLLDQVERLGDEVRSETDKLAGLVTLGVPAASGQLIVPALLDHLAQHHPGIRLRIVEGVSSENYNRLLTRTVDICLIYDPLPHMELSLHPLAVEDMYLVGRADLLAGFGASARLRDIEGLPMILPTAPNSRRLLVEKAFLENALVLNVAAEVDSFVVMRALLARGKGYSLATLSSVDDMLKANPLSHVALVPDRISWVLSVAHHNANADNPVVRAVIKALHKLVGELIGSGYWKGVRPHRSVNARKADPRPSEGTGGLRGLS